MRWVLRPGLVSPSTALSSGIPVLGRNPRGFAVRGPSDGDVGCASRRVCWSRVDEVQAVLRHRMLRHRPWETCSSTRFDPRVSRDGAHCSSRHRRAHRLGGVPPRRRHRGLQIEIARHVRTRSLNRVSWVPHSPRVMTERSSRGQTGLFPGQPASRLAPSELRSARPVRLCRSRLGRPPRG